MKSLLLNPNLCCTAQPLDLNNGNGFLLWLWCSRGISGEGNAKFLTRKVFPSLAFQQLLEGEELQAPCQALCLYERSLLLISLKMELKSINSMFYYYSCTAATSLSQLGRQAAHSRE